MASDAQSLQTHYRVLDEWRRDHGMPLDEDDLYPTPGHDERSRYGSYIPASVLELQENAPPPSGLREAAA